MDFKVNPDNVDTSSQSKTYVNQSKYDGGVKWQCQFIQSGITNKSIISADYAQLKTESR